MAKKIKRYNVVYNTTMSHEATVEALSTEHAEKKVREVIGDDVEIEACWIVRESSGS